MILKRRKKLGHFDNIVASTQKSSQIIWKTKRAIYQMARQGLLLPLAAL
jgi:hypothetical protein